MRLSDIHSAVQVRVWVVSTDPKKELRRGYAQVEFSTIRGEFDLIQQANLVPVKLVGKSGAQDLSHLLRTGRAHLAYVERIAKDGSACLLVHFFNGAVVEMGTVEITIDDHVESSARRVFRAKEYALQGVLGLLEDKCLLRLNSADAEGYFLFTAGTAADSDFDDSGNHNTRTPRNPQANGAEGSANSLKQMPSAVAVPQTDERCFCIHGDGIRVPVVRRQIGDKQIFVASRLISSMGREADAAVRLARGRISFSDYRNSRAIRSLASGALARLLQNKGSYLKKWDEYGEAEGELLLARARRVGALSFINWEGVSGGIRFFFDAPLPAGLSQGDELDIVVELPSYLSDLQMTWQEYCAEEKLVWGQRNPDPFRDREVRNVTDQSVGSGIQEEISRATLASPDLQSEPDLQHDDLDPDTSLLSADESQVERDHKSPASAILGLRILRVFEKSLDLKLEIPPSHTNVKLVLSLSGERVQIERRLRTRQLIVDERCANPLLGLIIEEGGEPPTIVRGPPIEPMTSFVRQKIFEYDPTEKQLEAIDIALNTPDIVLIQGPPGTGKTTVIAAIIERLNELSDKERMIRGDILISGFQHDAVENIMARLSVNSVPVPKFGSRSGQPETADVTADHLRQWCLGVAERARAKYPGVRQSEDQRHLAVLCRQYLLSPSLNNALNLVQGTLTLPPEILGTELTRRAHSLQELLREQAGPPDSGYEDVLQAIRSLRVTDIAFADDGAARAADVMARCGAYLTEQEAADLKVAISWRPGDGLDLLQKLKRLKRGLLERYTPRPRFRIEKPREDVKRLIEDVQQRVQAYATSRAGKIDTILAEFLHQLENDPVGIQRAVAEYGYVYAATCQQALGRPIARQKAHSAALDYDTVIVDEAARASPRDLLIPMAQARKRIILVGDHRQLPHLINEEVGLMLESQGSSDLNEQKFINTSMFQYLFKRLGKLEQRDNIPRRVTLDKQFRMHPVLGNFVSDQFYREFNEAFKSPLGAKHFSHDLEGTNGCPAAWLDVPAAEGGESRSGTSRCRYAEARRIADVLKTWIDSPEGRGLSFGVISFYKAQVNEIYAALAEGGYVRRAAEDAWEISSDYAFLPLAPGGQPQERLRIGTVDAFQGMEFDVVILSMVRTSRYSPHPKEDPAQRTEQQRGLFGHLISRNRLCVSMSRQKRLLVVAGDARMLQGELALEAVPALVAFHALCQSEGVVL